MDNKLQVLTDRLYEEGLSKGRAEGEKILEQARKNAEEIESAARANAAKIVTDAEKAAEDLRAKVESDIKMASSQALQATRKDIEDLVIAKIADTKVDKALADPDFLKKIITEVAKRFSTQESSELTLVLPESLKASLEPFVKDSLGKEIGAGVTGVFSKKIAGGFTVGPKDGSWFVDLSDGTFKALIGEYLRPVTRKFLFGDK